MDFRRILEEKMDEATVKWSRPERRDAVLDPAHLAFLLGNIEVRRFPASKPKFSGRRPAPTPKPRPARPSGPPHSLNERQKSATDWFKERGESLEPDFTAVELKAAFRRLARRLHPDVGGTAEEFLRLKALHGALKSVFA